MERFHRRGTVILSAALLLIGVAQLVAAAVRGSGVGAWVVGILFAAVGAGRLYIESRRR